MSEHPEESDYDARVAEALDAAVRRAGGGRLYPPLRIVGGESAHVVPIPPRDGPRSSPEGGLSEPPSDRSAFDD